MCCALFSVSPVLSSMLAAQSASDQYRDPDKNGTTFTDQTGPTKRDGSYYSFLVPNSLDK